MNNLEENLKKIKIKKISEEDKENLWHSIMTRRVEASMNENKLLGFNFFNLNMNMKKIFAGIAVLVLVLGGGGVVAASNNAVPGSFLFPVELALENIQLKLSSNEKKEKLRLRFTEERFEEIRKISEKRSEPSSDLVANLSDTEILEVEADVFVNETIVKIEANNKKYGYTSALKTKPELIKEISLKYSIAEEKVSSVIDFEVEDRDSRADDKEFLNKSRSINFSDDESKDVSKVLSEIEKLLNDDGEEQSKEELKKSLEAILVLLGDEGKLEIRRNDGKIKVETKDGEIKIKMEVKDDSSKKEKEEDKNDDDKNNKNKEDDKNDDDGNDDLTNSSSSDDDSADDVKEDDDEVFCRGEWRDEDDCEDDSLEDLKDDGEDDDNSVDEDKKDDDSGKDEDEDKSGEDNDEDDDSNSGKNDSSDNDDDKNEDESKNSGGSND